MDKRFTPEQILTRWEQQREVKNLMVRMISQDCLFRREHLAYETYWSRRPDVCLGVNEGYYQGADAVRGYFAAVEAQTALESRLLQQKFPTRLGDKTDEEVYGVGGLRYKAMEIPVVEIAGDGQTAKAIYHIHGCNTRLTPAGQVSYWERSWVACDLVLEDGQWRVWHLLYVTDIDHPCGTKWTDTPPVYDEDPALAAMKTVSFPAPNVAVCNRERYHGKRPLTPPPEYPLPYDTFAETFSYGI
jgi:hypothetical protein